jgi:hypothetical protein
LNLQPAVLETAALPVELYPSAPSPGCGRMRALHSPPRQRRARGATHLSLSIAMIGMHLEGAAGAAARRRSAHDSNRPGPTVGGVGSAILLSLPQRWPAALDVSRAVRTRSRHPCSLPWRDPSDSVAKGCFMWPSDRRRSRGPRALIGRPRHCAGGARASAHPRRRPGPARLRACQRGRVHPPAPCRARTARRDGCCGRTWRTLATSTLTLGQWWVIRSARVLSLMAQSRKPSWAASWPTQRGRRRGCAWSRSPRSHTAKALR